jgi:hypothetical protein
MQRSKEKNRSKDAKKNFTLRRKEEFHVKTQKRERSKDAKQK